MNKKFIKLITLLVITTFLFQNLAWADGPSLLRADSNRFYREFGAAVNDRPGTEDDEWEAFNGKGPNVWNGKRSPFPAGIDQRRLQAFWDEYGDFGVIEGWIDEEREFFYDIYQQKDADPDAIKAIKEFSALIERLNTLLSQLTFFPAGTIVRLTTKGTYPVLYHKEDKILEIHAVLLTPQVDPDTLLFIGRHDERHFTIEGIDPWWEEILNIYMDIVYLKENSGVSSRIISVLKNLEGEEGYWKLLLKRDMAFGTVSQQEEFLKEVIKHIWNYHPTLHPPTAVPNGKMAAENILDMLQMEIERPAGQLITLWHLARCGQLDIFQQMHQDAVPSPVQFLSLLSTALLKDIAGLGLDDLSLTKRWMKAEDSIYEMVQEAEKPVGTVSLGLNINWAEIITQRLWLNNKIEAIAYTGAKRSYFPKKKTKDWLSRGLLVGGYDIRLQRALYIPVEKQNKIWAKKLIHEYSFGPLWSDIVSAYTKRQEQKWQEEVEKIPEYKRLELRARWEKRLRKDLKILETVYNVARESFNRQGLPVMEISGEPTLIHSLNTACMIVELGGDVWAVTAAILHRTVPGALKELRRLDFITTSDIRRIEYIIEQSNKIDSLPFYPMEGSRRAIQNFMNLKIQLSVDSSGRPDPNIILLSLVDKFYWLKALALKPEAYRDLSPFLKGYLDQNVPLISASLAEWFGLDDLAVQFKDLYFRITNPAEYERIKREIARVLGIKEYDNLEEILEEIGSNVEDRLAQLDIGTIRVKARVKSIYSVWEKMEVKSEIYPTVETIHDLLGIQVIIPRSEVYKQHSEKIWDVLKRVFAYMESFEHKIPGQYGYEEHDFIGKTQDGLKVEVQIYPSEKDFRSQHIGLRAHWLHKLKLVINRLESPKQEFDDELLGQIQNQFTGDFQKDFEVIYKALSRWVFAGIVVNDRRDKFKDKIHIVRLPRGAIDAELAGARGVDQLNDAFQGIRDITGVVLKEGKLELPEVRLDVRKVRPGVFMVVKGMPAQAESLDDRFRDIKEKTSRLRTYLLASRVLDKDLVRIGETRGRALLNEAFQRLGYLENYLNTYRGKSLIFPLARKLGLADISELYELLYQVNKKGEERWYGELHSQLIEELTNERPRGLITREILKSKLIGMGCKVKAIKVIHMEFIAYLITAPGRGEDLLRKHGVNLKNKEVQQRLELILPEYGLSGLEQLCARLGIEPGFIQVLRIKYLTAGFPMVRFKVQNVSGIIDAIFKIMEMEDLDVVDLDEKDNSIIVYFTQPRVFARDAINRVLDSVKELPGVEKASVDYISTGTKELARKEIIISLPAAKKMEALRVISGLMKDLGIAIHVERTIRKKPLTFTADIPKQMPLNLFKEALQKRLQAAGVKYKDIQIIDPKPKKPPSGLSGLASMILVILAPYLLGSAGSLGIFGHIVLIAGIPLAAYLTYRLCKNIGRKRKIEDFIRGVTEGKEITISDLWILQAFFEEAILKKPRVLVLDAEVFSELNDTNSKKLADLINQIQGRVAIVSDSGVSKDDLIEQIYGFWRKNSVWLTDKAQKRFGNILENIYIRVNESKDDFARHIYLSIQERFRVSPENIMLFTTKRGFIGMWRRLLKNTICYILYEDSLYLTSEQLLAIQKVTGKDEISIEPGKTLQLLPEQFYNKDDWEELSQRKAEKSV